MQYTKAILAGLIAIVGGIAVGYTDDSLTRGEFWTALSAGLVALGGVFQVPNKDAGEGGGVEPGSLALGLVLGAFLVYLILSR